MPSESYSLEKKLPIVSNTFKYYVMLIKQINNYITGLVKRSNTVDTLEKFKVTTCCIIQQEVVETTITFVMDVVD